MQLYGYQERVIAEVEQHKNPLIVSPTGSGKTVMASAIIERNPNKFVLIFAHRRELVFQPRDTLAQCGVNAGVILAGESMNRMARVQIASVQTLHSRCIRGSEHLPPADIVFIDEAHHVTAKSYRAIIGKYPTAKIIGMTATPCSGTAEGSATCSVG
jgi:superfamily II DNA or RNA helicase